MSDQDSIECAFGKHHYKQLSQPAISALAVRAGCDQNDGKTYADSLGPAVAKGLVNESDIDVALARILRQRFLVGSFDPAGGIPYRDIPITEMESGPHKATSLAAAREAVVLLANNPSRAGSAGRGVSGTSGSPAGRPTLPLRKAPMKIAVIGPFANNSLSPYGGKPDYLSSFTITLLEGVEAAAGETGATVTYTVGSGVTEPNTTALHDAVAMAKLADVVILSLGIDSSIEHEGSDRTTIGLPSCQTALMIEVADAAAGDVVVILSNGGPLSSDYLAAATAAASPSIHAVVEGFELGPYTGQVLAEVLWGETNPSGMLPFTLHPEGFVNETSMLDMSMRAGPGRTYRFLRSPPLWPFGWGLSFTTFTTEWTAQPAATATTADPKMAFTVKVTNAGNVAGAKPVQAYITAVGTATDDYPVRSLFGLEKVMLQPGESATLSFSSAPRASYCTWCTVDAAGERAIRPGEYTIQIGGDGAGPENGVTATVKLTGIVVPQEI